MLPSLTLPLPPEDFLARYWQKAPLLMRGAASGLEHPEPDLLASLALDEAVESRLVQGTGYGPYRMHSGPFEEDSFTSVPRENWTLLVQSVDHYLTEVSLLLDSFDFLPGWRLEDIMISYAATGGSVGPHYDRYDVFLVQARGTRRWHIGPVCTPGTPVDTDGGLVTLPEMPVEEEYLLGPGDVLYLPPWRAHWGIAADSDCVTWSVGFRAPALAEILARVAEQADQGRAPVYADPDRKPTPAPGRLLDDDCAGLVDAAAGLLSDDSSRENALGQLLSEPRQESLDFEIDISHIRQRAPDSALVRHGGARFLITGEGDDARLWINGRARHLEPGQRPLAELLAARRLITTTQLAAVMTPEGKSLLEEWIDDGYVQRIQP